MAALTALDVTDDRKPAAQDAETHDPAFAVVMPNIFDLIDRTRKNQRRLGEIEPAVAQRRLSLGWIESDLHDLPYIQ